MDGTKRNARGEPLQDKNAIIDLGATPPWSLPPVYHEESALRSTQSPAGKRTVYPPALERHPGDLRRGPSWSPLSEDAATLLIQQQHGQRRAGKKAPTYMPPKHAATNEPEDDDDNDSPLQVDTEDGRDSVYMINCRGDSWSAPLASEDEPGAQDRLTEQAELALKHIKRAQELAAKQQRQHLQPQRKSHQVAPKLEKASRFSKAEKIKWRKDLLLRNLIRGIKRELCAGATLTLERLGPVYFPILCAHPLCPATDRVMPKESYYVVLGQPQQVQNRPRVCLFCLEGLWDGLGMHAPLPDPKVKVAKKAEGLEKQVVDLDLDGAGSDHVIELPRYDTLVANTPQSDGPGDLPSDLLSSKHAPPKDKLTDEYLASLHERCETPGGAYSRESSVTSEGEWKTPPTRFQHLAPFLRVGDSLNAKEKAAVKVWKAASEEQLQWERHLANTASRRAAEEAGSGASKPEPDDRLELTRNNLGDLEGGEIVEKEECDASNMRMPRRVNGNASLPPKATRVTSGEEEEDIEPLEALAGITRRECRGMDLSGVLADVRARSAL